MTTDFTFLIGGEAGQGIQTIGQILAKAFVKGGLHIFANQDYESRIRGGHNFFQIRVKTTPIHAPSEEVNMVIALNKETIDLHIKETAEEGVILYDNEKTKIDTPEKRLFGAPLERLAVEKGSNKVMMNSVATGAAMGLIEYKFELLAEVLREHFNEKGTEVTENNIKAAKAGYDYARENYKGKFHHPIEAAPNSPKRLMLNGNDAIALGALAAGCKFMASYPMTPSTPIMQYLASKANEYRLVVIQAEDEIAAMNMTVGAAFTGTRALVATSGDGFALMVEGLGLAGMTETPVVAVVGQRPGPAVGLPTRTAQSDLLFILNAGDDEFPRIILAPQTAEDAFYLTTKAFNLAEKYQMPVIILTDQHIADSLYTVDESAIDFSKVKIERGTLLSDEEAEATVEYKRHKLTESGVSPRALPGQRGVLVVTDSDEHTEDGHLTEDLTIRPKMVLKRLTKLETAATEIQPPKLYGSEKAKTTLIGWGSTYGAIKEATDRLREEGYDVNMLHLNEIWPLPAEAVSAALETSATCITVENNATAQLARLIRTETGKHVKGRILRFDGRPFTPTQIMRQVKEVVGR